jgi:hypothetical protein
MLAFKSLLHQTLQSLFGQVYSGLSIDILSHGVTNTKSVDIILRILSLDRDMILQTLPCITSYSGHRCTLTLRKCTPHLFLIQT